MVRDDLKSFISRCQEQDIQEKVSVHYRGYLDRKSKWSRENPEKLKESHRKYCKSEKGAYIVSKCRVKSRRKKIKLLVDKDIQENISQDEKVKIGKFYANCPKGFEVDHIIPISRGGKHVISNLQYLTKRQNRKKHGKILSKHIDLFWKEYFIKNGF